MKMYFNNLLSSTAALLGHSLFQNVKLSRKTSVSPRKQSDTTPFTQYTFDFIMHMHTERVRYNLTSKEKGLPMVTVQDLVQEVNKQMGTNKSRSTIARVWQGRIERDSLATGYAYFEWK